MNLEEARNTIEELKLQKIALIALAKEYRYGDPVKAKEMFDESEIIHKDKDPTYLENRYRDLRKVKITKGAFQGETGWVTGEENEAKAYPITLKSGMALAWFYDEFEYLPQ